MHAQVTAYRGRIIVELLSKLPIPGEVIKVPGPSQNSIHIIKDTAHHLGVSIEALDLLKHIKRSPAAAGELDWSQDAEGHACFGWLGTDCFMISPEACVASNKFKVRACITIPNIVPAEAKRQLDKYARLPTPAVGLLTGEVL